MHNRTFDGFILDLGTVVDDIKIKEEIKKTREIINKINEDQIINDECANAFLFEAQLDKLLTMLEKKIEELPDAKKASPQKHLNTFKNKDLPELLKTENMGFIQYPIKNYSKVLKNLEWQIVGDKKVAIFYGHDSFKFVTGKIFDKMRINNPKEYHLEINLPPSTQDEREKTRNNPNYLIDEYALIAFKEAAKVGISPEKVILNIDGKRITADSSAIMEQKKHLQSIAQNALKNLLKKSTSADEPHSEPEPSTSSSPRP